MLSDVAGPGNQLRWCHTGHISWHLLTVFCWTVQAARSRDIWFSIPFNEISAGGFPKITNGQHKYPTGGRIMPSVTSALGPRGSSPENIIFQNIPNFRIFFNIFEIFTFFFFFRVQRNVDQFGPASSLRTNFLPVSSLFSLYSLSLPSFFPFPSGLGDIKRRRCKV